MNFFERQANSKGVYYHQTGLAKKMLKMFLHPELIMVTTITKTLESINSIIEHIVTLSFVLKT